MVAYEVFVNGNRLCTAGIDGDGVLTAMLDYGRGKRIDHLHLTVGGLVSSTREHLTWPGTFLKLGDEVRAKVVDAPSVDEPERREPANSEQELENRKAFVRAMAGKWGWTLTEGSEHV
jgi:hypothetical protein